ncbi:MAG: sensor histidine kinase [Anaerolineae bacterium]
MSRSLSFPVKLALTLALTIAVAVGATSLLVNLSARLHFQDYITMGMRTRLPGLASALAGYYTERGDWEGIEAPLRAYAQEVAGRGRMMHGAPPMPLILADGEGRIVVDTAGRTQGGRLTPRSTARAQPIDANGRTVGYLLVGTGPLEESYYASLNRSILLAGGLTAAVAILLGLLLTQGVLRPLRDVRVAAERIGTGDLAYRAPVTSDDEIGRLAQRFNEMAATLQRDEELRRTMVADVAHELRTPLAVIRGHVEALQDGVFDLSIENLDPIHHQAVLLGRLVDDLRDLALAEAGQLPLEYAEISLDDLVRRTMAGFLPRARQKQVALESDLADANVLVKADAQRLEQVLGNLLDNALRHTPAGGIVRVSVRGEGNRVALEVTDTGAGIAPKDRARVFDRFYRADKARSRAEGGSGLGLSIAKRLVEAHGGTIAVESTPGAGSTFTVLLPSASGLAAGSTGSDKAPGSSLRKATDTQT